MPFDDACRYRKGCGRIGLTGRGQVDENLQPTHGTRAGNGCFFVHHPARSPAPVQAAGTDVLYSTETVAVDEAVGRIREQKGDGRKSRMGVRGKGWASHFEPVDVEDRIDEIVERLAWILPRRKCRSKPHFRRGVDRRKVDHGHFLARLGALCASKTVQKSLVFGMIKFHFWNNEAIARRPRVVRGHCG